VHWPFSADLSCSVCIHWIQNIQSKLHSTLHLQSCKILCGFLTFPLQYILIKTKYNNTHVWHHFPIPLVACAFTCDCSAQIFIKTLTGRKQAFNFEPENQVLVVKQALQEKEGIQVDQIRLIHSGKQLADDKTLESYNIAAGATIHMVLQLRGGF